jgi:hypothetical protein
MSVTSLLRHHLVLSNIFDTKSSDKIKLNPDNKGYKTIVQRYLSKYNNHARMGLHLPKYSIIHIRSITSFNMDYLHGMLECFVCEVERREETFKPCITRPLAFYFNLFIPGKKSNIPIIKTA